jgi:hypothetical protein
MARCWQGRHGHDSELTLRTIVSQLKIKLWILAWILEEDIDIADQGGVLDIITGKLAPGQRAGAPTDVQLNISSVKKTE